jgi:hypothetical protein
MRIRSAIIANATDGAAVEADASAEGKQAGGYP